MSTASPLAKGCFTFLGVFALSAVFVAAITYIRLPHPEGASREAVAGCTGLASGFFLTFAIMLFSEVVRRTRELAMLRASVAGVPLTDGARVAASGVLVADGPLLDAPFSGTPSAIYKYGIVANHKKSSTEICSGYALTPCHVETPAGHVRILGYAELAFSPASLKGPEMLARARAYLAPGIVTPLGLGAAKEFLGTLVDDDGAIKSDTGLVPDELNDPVFSFLEHVVADREKVCAFGRYSAERGGLVPDPASIDPYPVRLRRGDPAAVRRSLLASAAGQVAAAVFMAALGVGAAWVPSLMFRP